MTDLASLAIEGQHTPGNHLPSGSAVHPILEEAWAIAIDRISRLPLAGAELLVATIRSKGARLAVPGIVDLNDLVADSAGVARIVLEAVQEMLLRVALQTARDDYETRRERQREGIELAKRAGRYTGRKPGLAQAGMSIARTAELAGCSIAHVKRVTAVHRAKAALDVSSPGPVAE